MLTFVWVPVHICPRQQSQRGKRDVPQALSPVRESRAAYRVMVRHLDFSIHLTITLTVLIHVEIVLCYSDNHRSNIRLAYFTFVDFFLIFTNDR